MQGPAVPVQLELKVAKSPVILKTEFALTVSNLFKFKKLPESVLKTEPDDNILVGETLIKDPVKSGNANY